jgi:DNA topoisomerase IB
MIGDRLGTADLDDGLGRGHELPPGLRRTDLHGPGYGRRRSPGGDFAYTDLAGTPLSGAPELERVRRLAIPPAWRDVWISPDAAGHIQAIGVDARGRRQYRYHPLWRAERDAEKFDHMLRFAQELPQLREACRVALVAPHLDHERVCACAVRVTELGLFRIGSERYAREDHTYGVTSLEKRHVRVGPRAGRVRVHGQVRQAPDGADRGV